MKKYLLLLAASLIIASCGNKNSEKSENANDSISVEENATTAIEDALDEDQIKTDISGVLSEAYAEAFKSLNLENVFSKYCSSEYLAIQQKYDKVNEGCIGSLEYDVWSQAQDTSNPSIVVKNVEVSSSEEAIATIELTNFGKTQDVILPMVNENGSWKIKDFIGTLGSAIDTMKSDF